MRELRLRGLNAFVGVQRIPLRYTVHLGLDTSQLVGTHTNFDLIEDSQLRRIFDGLTGACPPQGVGRKMYFE